MSSFSNCEKSYNKQVAVSYIAYMMCGSYFHRCRFQRDEEIHMYLHYAEMPRSKQYEYEEKMIKAMEHLDQQFLKAIQNLITVAAFRREDENYILEFRTGGFEGLRCEIQNTGKFRLTKVSPAK